MKLRFIAPLILLILFSCSDGEGLMHSQGLLLGSEDPMCSCCPEDIDLIKIQGKIYRYHHEELPDGFRGFLNTSDIDYLVEVELYWKRKNNQCPKNEILITEIDLAD
jgi:hypothetical protein